MFRSFHWGSHPRLILHGVGMAERCSAPSVLCFIASVMTTSWAFALILAVHPQLLVGKVAANLVVWV